MQSLTESTYLRFDVVKRWGTDDGKADEEDVGLRVRQRSEAVVIFLSGGIPQSQADRSAIHHHTGCVVVEARGSARCGRSGSLVARAERRYEVTYTVGIYSPGNALVVYEIRRQV